MNTSHLQLPKRRTRSSFIQPSQQRQNQLKQSSSNIIQEQNNQQQINQPLPINIENSSFKLPVNICPKKSNWNRKQKIKYMVFIDYYSQLPNWKNDSKNLTIYKSLSLFIKSRSPEQCKSFHLAIKRSIKCIDQIVKFIYEELQYQDNFDKLIQRYKNQIISFEEEHQLLQQNQLSSKSHFNRKNSNSNEQKSSNNLISKNNSHSEDKSSKSSPSQIIIENNQAIENSVENKKYQQNKKSNQIIFNKQLQQHNSSNVLFPNIYKENMSPSKSNKNNLPRFSILPRQNEQNLRRVLQSNKFTGTIPSFAQKYFTPHTIQNNMNEFNRLTNSFYQNQFPYLSYHNNNDQNYPIYMNQYQNYLPAEIMRDRHPFLQNFNSFNFEQANYNNLNNNQQNNQLLFKNQQKSILSQSVYKNGQQKKKINQNNKVPDNQGQKEQNISQRQKQLTLNCHKHWINWMCAVIQLQNRKLSQNQVK